MADERLRLESNPAEKIREFNVLLTILLIAVHTDGHEKILSCAGQLE